MSEIDGTARSLSVGLLKAKVSHEKQEINNIADKKIDLYLFCCLTIIMIAFIFYKLLHNQW